LCREVISTSKSIKDAAVAYGVGLETLRNWLIKHREANGGTETALSTRLPNPQRSPLLLPTAGHGSVRNQSNPLSEILAAAQTAHYRHVMLDDRIEIARLRDRGISKAEIARQLGVHRSTITRELRRGSRQPERDHAALMPGACEHALP
jgi:transposase-like protein